MKQVMLIAIAGLGLLCNSTPAAASVISYTEQASATGTLGGTPFTNALVTITGIGNTANVTAAGILRNVLSSATVTVAGIGTAAITSSIEVFDNQLFQPTAAVGIGLAGGNGSILDTVNSQFSTYDLTFAIGPVSGTSLINSSVNTNTTLGVLNFTSAQNSTFTAGTPEPGSWMLMGLGFSALASKLRRAKSHRC